MSCSLLESHLKTSQSFLSGQPTNNSKSLAKTVNKKSVVKETNYVVKARKDILKKQQKVEQTIHLIGLSQPKKKSRKLLKKLVKEQSKSKGK